MRKDLGLAATMLSRALPRTIQAVLSCGTNNCTWVTKAMEHFHTLYPSAAAEDTGKSILCCVGDCLNGCAEAMDFETEDPKSKPGGIPLASLSGREAGAVPGTGAVLGGRGRRFWTSQASTSRM